MRSTVPARSPSSSGRSTGVALADLGQSPPVRVEHVVEVLLGQRGPAGLELDADGAPVEEGGLDDRGADPGERVDDELARASSTR